jgi:hypothetical protein
MMKKTWCCGEWTVARGLRCCGGTLRSSIRMVSLCMSAKAIIPYALLCQLCAQSMILNLLLVILDSSFDCTVHGRVCEGSKTILLII